MTPIPPSGDLDTPMSEQEQAIREVASILLREERELQRLSDMPYDGIHGVLPEWVPPYFRSAFERIRHNLILSGHCASDILRYLDCYCADEGKLWPLIIQNGITEEVGFLAKLRYAVSKGESEGLALLGGEDARRGRDVLRASRRGTMVKQEKKADKYRHLLHDAIEVARLHPKWNLKAIRATVAEQHKVSKRTVERHTPGLRGAIRKTTS